MKVFADELGYEQKKFMNFNKLLFPWKPVDVQLGTISENACIGAKFHACIKNSLRASSLFGSHARSIAARGLGRG